MTKESRAQNAPARGIQPEYLSDNQVASYLSVTRDTIWRWAREGRLPAPIKIGPNSTRWRRSEIDLRLNQVPGRESDKRASVKPAANTKFPGAKNEQDKSD